MESDLEAAKYREKLGTEKSRLFLVTIKEPEKKRTLIPQLQSLNATAIILSYTGNTGQVYHILQRLCHSSRAYILQ